jgi:hypothetical protein
VGIEADAFQVYLRLRTKSLTYYARIGGALSEIINSEGVNIQVWRYSPTDIATEVRTPIQV